MQAHEIADRAYSAINKPRRLSDGSYAVVDRLVMYERTFAELLRDRVTAAYTNYPYHIRPQGEPLKFFGVTVAFDDSLAFGEVQGAMVLP
jgi:hypothetical protein